MVSAQDFEACVIANRDKWIGYAAQQMPVQDAEDVVQESIFKAWRALPRFKAESTLSTWMTSIVRNEMRGRYRRAVIRGELLPAPEPQEITIQETITRSVLFSQVMRMINRLKRTKRSGLMALYRGEFSGPALKSSRYRGIQDVRVMMAQPIRRTA